MTLVADAAAVAALVAVAPLTVWAERRVKAWTQLRLGPPPLQLYRDLRKLLAKRPTMPAEATALWLAAPFVALGAALAAAFLLPLSGPGAGLGGGVGLVALALLLALHRAALAAHGFDSTTPFGGIGASRELFLGGLTEPVILLVGAGVVLQTGSAGIPGTPLAWSAPATWPLLVAVAVLFLAETARIPIDNPATHLELTMVHEAMIIEAGGWVLALHELAAFVKQAVLAALIVLLAFPLPADAASRIALLAVLVVGVSGGAALVESGVAKVRLFRASHLLIMAAFLALLGVLVGLLEGVAA